MTSEEVSNTQQLLHPMRYWDPGKSQRLILGKLFLDLCGGDISD